MLYKAYMYANTWKHIDRYIPTITSPSQTRTPLPSVTSRNVHLSNTVYHHVPATISVSSASRRNMTANTARRAAASSVTDSNAAGRRRLNAGGTVVSCRSSVGLSAWTMPSAPLKCLYSVGQCKPPFTAASRHPQAAEFINISHRWCRWHYL